MDLSKRFEIHQQLGEGSFSKIYQAFDKKLKSEVALKVEKEDKHKKILKFEYEILKHLQGLLHVPRVYDFVENTNKSVIFNGGRQNQAGILNNGGVPITPGKNEGNISSNNSASEGLNFIVMELLGKNVANYKKSKHSFDNLNAYDILLQMLDAIEQLHDRGYIHRDIKPTNFVVKENINKNNKHKVGHVHVYMVDYGLAKIHLDRFYRPLPPRHNTDFRGTLTYASLNAHYKKELSRRDDLWSFFFVILDLLNENLPWRTCKDDKDDIKKVKEICLADPEKKLLLTTTKGKKEIIDILNHIKSLNYSDRPNYNVIRIKLNELRMQEINKFTRLNLSINNLNSLGINENIFNNANLSNINNMKNLNNVYSQCNNLGMANIKNYNSLNNMNNFQNVNFQNANKNFILYDIQNKQNENDSPTTKDDFFAKNFICNSPLNKNNANGVKNANIANNINGLNNNFSESHNLIRGTASNFTTSANYFNNYSNNFGENLQNQINYMTGNNNSNLGAVNSITGNINSNNLNGNNINLNVNNSNTMGHFTNRNFLNLPDNFNMNNYLCNAPNYMDLTKKLYIDNIMQMNVPPASLESNNSSNIYNNIINGMNLSLGGGLHNSINNFNNLGNISSINNISSLNNLNSINNLSGLSNLNGLNMGSIHNFNNLSDLNTMSNVNIQLPNGIGNLINNQLQSYPHLYQNFFPSQIEEKCKEALNLTLSNTVINKKRKRSPAHDDLEKNNIMSTQQQNQIFIINQFTKNQPTELENKLVDFLMKQTLPNTENNDHKQQINNNSNEILQNNHKNSTSNKRDKDNDKMLINSIIQKLKPNERKQENSLNKSITTDPNTNLNQNNPNNIKESELILNINEIINKLNTNDLDQLLKNVLIKNANSCDSIKGNLKNIFSGMNYLELIKNRSDQQNGKIFKIEKKLKK